MVKQQLLKDLQDVLTSLGYKTSDIVLSIPQNTSFGDYSTNIALQLAKLKSKNGKQSPLEIANKIVEKLKSFNFTQDNLSEIKIVEPGFINFFVRPESLNADLIDILKLGQDFGKSSIGKNKRARVEYVSANPTGPLHFGNARGGPIGDVISNVLEFEGYKVLREYLDNDRGNQILELGKTIAARARLISIPEEQLTYKGEYTKELAEKIKSQIDSGLEKEKIIAQAGELGVKILFEEIIKDCKDTGINYDNIVHESQLQQQAPAVLDFLKTKGILKKADGALWFAPKSEYLKDREAVVVKSDGAYTYFTADIVYHKEKFESGYDLVVDVFGSNTSGHVPKLNALAEILGFDIEKFKVILYQFVRVKRGDEVVKMSKRAGNFVTVREVLDEVGTDALRFFILMYDPNTHMDFDLELAKQQSNKNPVYYVQYAYARMSNILKKAKISPDGSSLNQLTSKPEISLIKHLLNFPDVVSSVSEDFGVQRLTHYAITLADLFHKFYESSRVIGAQTKELEQARLSLVKASQIVLKNTLDLMGVTAPARM